MISKEEIGAGEEECLSTKSGDENLNVLNNFLKFERKQHSDDIFKKSAEFSRYIKTHPDIKSLEAHLFKISTCVCDTDYLYSNYLSSFAGCGSCIGKSGPESEVKREHWITTLLALHKFGCDQAAINATKQCKFCKIERNLLVGWFTNEDPRNVLIEKERIKELSQWQPDPNKLKKNVYE